MFWLSCPPITSRLRSDDPNKFIAMMGAEAVDTALKRVDLAYPMPFVIRL